MKKKEMNMNKYIMEKESEFAQYIECIKSYIDYYDRRSRFYKGLYYVLNIVKLASVACVPVLEIVCSDMTLNWVVVAASSLAILCESTVGIFKAKEKWIEYRNTCDKLAQEQRIFMMKSESYDEMKEQQECEKAFVKHIEAIIGKENGSWKEYMKKKNDSEK